MCFCGEKLLDNVPVEQPLGSVDSVLMGNSANLRQKKSNANRATWKYSFRKMQEKGILGIAIPKLVQVRFLRYEHATLITSSTTSFGNECMRLINIAFHTSQLFPSVMGTYDAVSRYIRKELVRQHPNRYFHVLIGEKDDFHFSTSDWNDFADVEQEQYRVLIFSTGSSKKTKIDDHKMNDQMRLQWKSVVIKRIDN